MPMDRRALLTGAGLMSLAGFSGRPAQAEDAGVAEKADYTMRIGTGRVELAPDTIVSTTLYNGRFPGPLLRFQEGQRAVVDIHNDTDTPELVHWHGQMVPTEVDGAAEEGSPFMPAHGTRRIILTQACGVPFLSYACQGRRRPHPRHVHGTGGTGLYRTRNNPGAYDREIFLVLKEFAPAFSHGGDMAMDTLAGDPVKALQDIGKQADATATRQSQGVRGRLQPVRDQRPHARARRSCSGQAGRAGAIPRAQRQRHGNPQPCAAGSYISGSSRSTAIRYPRRRKCRCCGSARPSAFPRSSR